MIMTLKPNIITFLKKEDTVKKKKEKIIQIHRTIPTLWREGAIDEERRMHPESLHEVGEELS